MWPSSSLTLYMLFLHSELFGPVLFSVLLFVGGSAANQFQAETFSILILQGLFYSSSARQKEIQATGDKMFFFPFYDCCHLVNWGGTDGTIKPPAWNWTGPSAILRTSGWPFATGELCLDLDSGYESGHQQMFREKASENCPSERQDTV